MAYIRMSIARPRHGQEQQLEDAMRKLNDLAKETPGCIATYLLRPHDDSSEIARISIYDSEASADAAANTNAFLVARSEMHLVTEPGHQERAFFSFD